MSMAKRFSARLGRFISKVSESIARPPTKPRKFDTRLPEGPTQVKALVEDLLDATPDGPIDLSVAVSAALTLTRLMIDEYPEDMRRELADRCADSLRRGLPEDGPAANILN